MVDDNVIESASFNEQVDMSTFEQILEMDEDDREFSKGIVFSFLDQAEATFEEMDTNIEKKDLNRLSELGHFLKGSSATLGLVKIKDECEKIQQYGLLKDLAGNATTDSVDVCLDKIKRALVLARSAFHTVSGLMREFYNDS